MRSLLLNEGRPFLAIVFLLLAPILLGALDEETRVKVDSLLASKNYEAALPILIQADKDFQDPQVLMRISDAIIHGGRYDHESGNLTLGGQGLSSDRLSRAHTQVLTAYPRYAALWLSLGNLAWFLYENGDQSESIRSGTRNRAIEAYEKALQLKLEAPGIQERLGLLFLDKGDETRAVSYLRAALAKFPDRPDLEFNIAYVLFIQKKAEEGLVHAESALKNSKDPAFRNNARLLYGELLLEAKRPLEAITIFTEAVNAEKDNVYPLRRLIECYLSTGNKAQIEKTVQAYLEKAPADIEALTKLGYLLEQYQEDELFLSMAKNLRQRYARSQTQAAAGIAFMEAQFLSSRSRNKEAVIILDKAMEYLAEDQENDYLLSEIKRFRAGLVSD